MPVGTIALIVTAAAILALWGGIRYGLPYLIDRDDALPDSPVSSVDILDRTAAEDALRTDSWQPEPSHRAPSAPYTPEQARTEMQRHCECGTDLCATKYQAYRTLVDAGHAIPDARAER
ncbi:hypothetical protein OG874_07430 [Nocardia sp. NBC_00565]|uniref:hypothetical protein n=1 Tax=Nocardia sp. NBC_00565 TaxID=2975993 RepID=UPI002E80334B|nr:hypothetical protein [Nocardia sp. NBC_00565]WUC04979.1 hypothetical protein OG874_07430 [Nocardia sp. NBC_00565]